MLNLLSNNSSDIADPTSLSPLPSDPAGQLDILGHNGDPLGMNGTQVCVLKQPNKVCFRCLLKGRHRAALEPQVRE
ncbi:hypothetical protein OIU77_026408 [Salix suchowensis]|uniref:Uncharacterized protein n=1 Tax=Salix suchowensis TaxID=1278906 RepID=A0ABQ9BL20_9ROSI|nr:hypothetical protein OIU77_026408 [Salix suchowensis]